MLPENYSGPPTLIEVCLLNPMNTSLCEMCVIADARRAERACVAVQEILIAD